jgi:hypothetical protein
MNTSTSFRRLPALVTLALAGLLFQAQAWSDDKPSPDADRIDALLHQSGYTYEQKAPGVWVIPQKGDSLGDFKVIVAVGDGITVVFVIVAAKADMDMDQDLAYKMLHMNHEYDRVKIGVDDDGDAFVRADASVRVLDETEFKDIVHQVSASADEVHAAIKPYLKQ